LLAASLACGSTLAACEQGQGGLRGDWLEVDDCKRIGSSQRYEPFNLSFDFAGISENLGTALIRMSNSARLIGQTDQVIISLDATEPVDAGLAAGGVFTLTLRPDGQGDADLSLSLLGRCKHATQAFAADGTLTFYDYGWKRGARMRGEMAFDLVDRRSGAVVGEHFVGDFDFESHTGSPWTAFSPRDY